VGLSSAGIGSGLDIEGLISKLMSAESAPLSNFDKKTAVLQAQLAALGKLGGAIGAFQGSLSTLSSAATFQALKTASGDDTILTGSATTSAVPGKYSVNVSQLAQAQSLSTGGKASNTTLLGAGATTVLNFQFGTVSGGQFGLAGSTLAAGVASTGIAAGSLSINGTAIATDGTTKSAKLLADAINAKTASTGVSASAAQTATSATLFGSAGSTSFGNVTTDAVSSYALSVGGVQIVSASGGAGVNAASIDTALTGNNATTAALAAANITFTGSAASGTLQFFAADGSNITVAEASSGGGVTGGINTATGTANAGSTVTATSSVTLASSTGSAITIGGSNPSLAGLTAGSGGSYLGAGFTQDGSIASGSVTLNAADQSLQGIRDAINKANIGVSASIVSDGSANPYHLVLTSTKTGANATMKISVAGDGTNPPDATLASLLGYDPAGAQGLVQTSAAQSTLANVNGIAVSSDSNSITGAIQGVTLNVAKLGTTTVDVSRDTKTVTDGVNAFVKAYNDLNKTIAGLTHYNADAKTAGPLQGDSTVRSIQSQLRRQLSTAIEGLGGSLTSLSQVGIAFQKDGSLAVDSTKLNNAVTNNFKDIGGLFAAIGSASDSLVSFTGSTAATKPGSYELNITNMASRGTLTSAAPLAASTVIAANTTWNVVVNQTDPATASKVQPIAIPAGTYTPSEMAAMLRAAINGNATFAGAGDTVEASVDASGNLAISSSKYGSTSNIAITDVSGSTVAGVFGAATPVVGTDVAGTIGGMAATGSGQTLTAADSSTAAGMKLSITGGATGSRGTVSFSQGYAYQLNNLAATFIGTSGLITGESDGLNVNIKSVAKSRDAFSERLADIEKRYRAQFTALDTAIASMQSTQNYLTQQLAALAKNS
jgi:flagellar hook-associated protein 2